MGAFLKRLITNVFPSVVSRLSAILSAILTCLLALLVASPLCCCAAERLQDQPSCCCGGDESPENQEPCHRCLCASDDPREVPDPDLVPPPLSGAPLTCPPASTVTDFSGIAAADLHRPRWMPCLPWHAPPAERRARLVSRLL
jgi:hypothetical protein